MATADGGIIGYGNVALHGSLATNRPASPIVAIVPTADGGGYWMAEANGTVRAFGDAATYGDLAGDAFGGTVVAMVVAPGGTGYWLATSSGGVYTFGDPAYEGSAMHTATTDPVVAMASTPDGKGYWLVTAEGHVHAFGDATDLGGLGGVHLTSPISAMTVTRSGHGYWLAAADGAVYSFGDASFDGSAPGSPPGDPIVAMAANPAGAGYWLVRADANVFAFGGAPARGPRGPLELESPVVAVSVAPGTGSGPTLGAFAGLNAGTYRTGTQGFDVSWPQCRPPLLPPSGQGIGIVGIEDGYSFSTNPCFSEEAAWAGAGLGVYINTDSPPSPPTAAATAGPAGNCPTNLSCQSYNWGWNNAQYAMGVLTSDGAALTTPVNWWLDVETGNSWSSNTSDNARVIQGAVDALRSKGLVVGVYSTNYLWKTITGGYTPSPLLPEWYPMGYAGNPQSWCGTTSPDGSVALEFSGGPVWIVQAPPYANPPNTTPDFDEDFAC